MDRKRLLKSYFSAAPKTAKLYESLRLPKKQKIYILTHYYYFFILC